MVMVTIYRYLGGLVTEHLFATCHDNSQLPIGAMLCVLVIALTVTFLCHLFAVFTFSNVHFFRGHLLSAPHNCNKTKIKHFYFRGLHICNKTKIKECYKTCRTRAAYLVLLDIIQIAKTGSQ